MGLASRRKVRASILLSHSIVHTNTLYKTIEVQIVKKLRTQLDHEKIRDEKIKEILTSAQLRTFFRQPNFDEVVNKHQHLLLCF